MEKEDLTKEQLRTLQNCDESGLRTPPPRLELLTSSMTPHIQRTNRNKNWRVRTALNFKGIEYDTRPVNLKKGEHNTPEYENLNPLKLVPTLIIDGQALTQSVAILEYLEETRPEPALLPKNPIDRAKVRAIVQSIASDIQPIQNLRVVKHSKQDDWGNYWITSGFRAIEKHLKETSGDYCFGDSITLADVFLVPQVYNANRYQVDLTEFPIIQKINARLNELQAFRDAHPSNQIDCPLIPGV
ncbi:2089_t:CDS:2 [Ambispora gerdemannii]|uniref:2089_t:CDS:1 n=1 Tax=Ambispora gerdemannii TaxID=144530 RepID=A0A9N9G690_9GLOM|nr:2089_t:CDS:2 [Ambispora gerdemannii]